MSFSCTKDNLKLMIFNYQIIFTWKRILFHQWFSPLSWVPYHTLQKRQPSQCHLPLELQLHRSADFRNSSTAARSFRPWGTCPSTSTCRPGPRRPSPERSSAFCPGRGSRPRSTSRTRSRARWKGPDFLWGQSGSRYDVNDDLQLQKQDENKMKKMVLIKYTILLD